MDIHRWREDKCSSHEDVSWCFDRSDGMSGSAALHEFSQALRIIPREQKNAYLEAREMCPSLLVLESDPVKFLMFEKENSTAAANRFVRFWEWRRRIFGDRCFSPMDLSGKGALSAADLALHESGFMRLLPRDSEGRDVVFLHPAFAPSSNRDRDRVFFYFLWRTMRNPVSMTRGCQVIVLLNPKIMPRCVGKLHRGTMLYEAFPVRFHGHIVIDFENCQEAQQDFQRRFVPMTIGIYRRPFTAHCGTPDETLSSLENYGVQARSLPPVLNGTFDNMAIECDSSMTHPSRAETQLLQGATPITEAMDAEQSKEKCYSLAPNAALISKTSETQSQTENHKTLKPYAAQSRLKRERARERESTLRSDYGLLLHANQRLQHENARLASLMQQANAMVELLNIDPTFNSKVLQKQTNCKSQLQG